MAATPDSSGLERSTPESLAEEARLRPPREFTLRAAVASIFVAGLMGASYPYIVLKLGFGPNVAVVSAFFGFLSLGLVYKDYNRWENNIVHAAGTAAAQAAFMCVLLAAFDMLATVPGLNFHFTLTPMQSFAWLTAAGLLGVFLAVPLRQHFVVDEKLTYADGVAAAETLIVLDARGPESKRAARSLGVGTLASAVVMLGQHFQRIPELIPFGALGAAMNMGVSTSLLGLGSGALVGMKVNASMMVGMVLAWAIAPVLLLKYGVISSLDRHAVLRWVMWPATGMLIAGGLTALVVRWRLLVKTFQHFSTGAVRSDEFPLRTAMLGAGVCSVALAVVQSVSLDMPVWMTVVAILLSLPMMLIGLRVLGETNWGPISALSNMMQGIFAWLAPGNILVNMTASGTTGTIATMSESLMQGYKAGYLIGGSPRYMTWAQLMGAPVGALAVSYMYPLLRSTYGIGGETGLSSPISAKWMGFAELLARGASALPAGALPAMVIFTLLGVVLTVLETRYEWLPSPTGIGMGMLVPGMYTITMFLGGVLEAIWRKKDPARADQYVTPLSSGLIAGEAIVAVVVPLLVLVGVMSA